ncbi:hypothetical protein [Streptomyces sp. NPDC051657]|uniref:hypothetical protein n=1 Tax=unclassified Streptomyces TaxID=2593676 RepID=UPI003413702B
MSPPASRPPARALTSSGAGSLFGASTEPATPVPGSTAMRWLDSVRSVRAAVRFEASVKTCMASLRGSRTSPTTRTG